MKILLTATLGTLLAAAAFAQTNCEPTIIDGAGVLSAEDISTLESQSRTLVDLGAEPHIITVMMAKSDNMDLLKKKLQDSCPSWQNPSGGMKSTLLLFMVAPKVHKVGYYFGSAFTHSLADHWNRIKADYMVPRFKDQAWAAGLAAGMEQTGKRIKSSQEEAEHGVVNEATDYSGLWRVLSWCLVLFGIGFLSYALLALIRRRHKESAAVNQAQQAAILARNTTADKLSKIQQAQAEYEAIDGKYKNQSKSLIGDALEQFGRLSNSSSTDPTENGKSVEQYRGISDAYSKLNASIANAKRWMNDIPSSSVGEPDNTAGIGSKRKSFTYGATTLASTEPQPQTIIHEHYHDSGNSDFTSGLVMGELLSDRRPAYVPEYVPPAPSYVPDPYKPSSSSWSSSSDDSSSGGGSSSWSDSSSSSDSGGSSSYDSGSSDSGGGSSSDW